MRTHPTLLLAVTSILCRCWGVRVTQDKKLVVRNLGEPVEMRCYQSESTYLSMYWYQQKPGEGLKLMVYSSQANDQTMEPNYTTTWTLNRNDTHNSLLTLKAAAAQDGAVYFCAATGSGTGSTVYFGSGTTVSVLEDGKKKTAPKVKIFRPSRKELGDHNLLSLVCVASGFYPEHVRIKWFVDDIHRENLYHPEAQNDSKGFYSTYKRLTLTRAEYFNPETKFKCVAAFLDGSEEASEYIEGETDCGVSKVRFGMSITQGKISYIMVLCKSGVYGLIVLAVLWRKKIIADS